METFRVNFPKHQQLPAGWHVEYWWCDEHYHYVCPEKTLKAKSIHRGGKLEKRRCFT